ncbi:TPR repeat [Rhizobium sp. RU20A]|uniref:tetratricopeptide repeat protein n=1 Tax=Rhizobium sp. RU20A TaxID=1907412 RepID=UPI000956C595|nr:tetratricopeptide repeat protein [Rhizobium sp. RU20A]SIQ06842.1 TPR repeat [Rhizobium sp. RU20A]
MAARTLLLAAPLLLALAPFAQAQTAAERCDQLAAHPADPQKPAGIAGVATGAIDIESAITACREAVAADPAPRLRYQLGRALFDSEDHAGAFAEISAAAESGLVIAKAQLGYLYDQGIGTNRDLQKAMTLYRAGADGNVGFAAHNLAVVLRDEKDAPIDHAASFALFQKAVSLGYDQSLVDVGFAYDTGNGVPQDYAEALVWYRKAAEKDIPEAENNIGVLYEEGNGVEQDASQALAWYRKAQAKDYPLADFNIAHMFANGIGMPADQAKAVELVLSGFDKGNADDDAFNRDFLFEDSWPSEFWVAMQAHLSLPQTGRLDAATKMAVEGLVGA